MTDPITGEIYSHHSNEIDALIEVIQVTEIEINNRRTLLNDCKQKLLTLAQFGETKTARIQGNQYKCKIELPSKIVWDQKKLAKIYHDGYCVSTVDIASYKVNMLKYKKMINTVGSESFNKYKEELISANLGTTGTPKFTIEE